MSPPLDALAAPYDARLSASPTARHLRARMYQRLDAHFGRGDHVLQLGCGGGEDALYLAERGVRVTATDSSPAMLELARTRTAHQPLVTVQPLDLRRLPAETEIMDGVIAGFGVLNRLIDWQPLAEWLAERLAPDGIAAFAIQSPWCLWEMGWRALHGDFDAALRRLRSDAEFRPTPDSVTPVAYPTIRRLSADFAPYFQRAHVEPFGLLLPPAEAASVERHHHIMNALTALDDRAAKMRAFSLLADYYWIEFERAS